VSSRCGLGSKCDLRGGSVLSLWVGKQVQLSAISSRCGLGSKAGLSGGSKFNALYSEMLRKDLQPCEVLVKCVRYCNFVSLYQVHEVLKHDIVVCKRKLVA
jgi:hypothetical protein